MKKALLTVVLSAGAGLLWAGAANYFETHVDLARNVAYGSLRDTRASADAVQYIGCDLYLSGGQARLNCLARDASSNRLSCASSDPEIVKISQAITDESYIYFRCNASGELDYLYVSRSSLWLE